MLRCLGYSATIAIAGCGCSKIGPDFGNFEASDGDYSTVGTIAEHDWGSSPLARKALSDGKLTQGEYRGIMNRFDADRAADAAQAKADALRRWGHTASVDTHPKGGDVQQAPLVSGAVAKPDAQTPPVQP